MGGTGYVVWVFQAMLWFLLHNNAILWSNLQDCKISSRAEIPKLDRVWQYLHTCIMAYFQIPSRYLPCTFQTCQKHFRGLPDTLYNLPNTLQTPFRLVYSPLELSGVVGGWVANTYIVMPLRGPTCKIARFQAELKFPNWTEFGKNKVPESDRRVASL